MATVYASSGNTVNLRKAPNGTVIKAVPIGATIEIIKEEGEWTEVEYNSTRGYMMTKFIKTSSTITKDDLKKVYNSLQDCLKTIENILK